MIIMDAPIFTQNSLKLLLSSCDFLASITDVYVLALKWPLYSTCRQPTFAISNTCPTKTIRDTITKICSYFKHFAMIFLIHFGASKANNCDIINKID